MMNIVVDTKAQVEHLGICTPLEEARAGKATGASGKQCDVNRSSVNHQFWDTAQETALSVPDTAS